MADPEGAAEAAEELPPSLRLLRDARRIAVVARSPRLDRPWHRIASYLVGAGYEVQLVNPQLDEALGRPCYDRVQDLPTPVDIVDVFRRGPETPPIAEDAVAAGAGVLWLQLGVVSVEAEEIAVAGGLAVVMDRCTLIEHQRLLALGVEAPRQRV
ncbi:MAG: CoA-binding protein [Chloroflexi bacterium]|nr:CoA-binding protein [Chloroflexota bacterium]